MLNISITEPAPRGAGMDASLHHAYGQAAEDDDLEGECMLFA